MKNISEIKTIRSVVLYIVNAFKDGVDYIKLFKIMYFVQKDHIVRFGKPMFPETFKAYKHGPVPSFSYAAIRNTENGNQDSSGAFIEGIKVCDKKVFATEEPDMNYISVVGKECLDRMIKKYHDTESYKMSGISHDKAWRDAIDRMQDDPQKNFMSIIDIAKAGNASPEMIDYIREKQLIMAELA